MDPKKVLIIGAGISGLTATKHALDAGLTPVTLERSKDLGGVWNPSTGRIWDRLSTNIVKYAAQFVEFPFTENIPAFPLGHHVFDYLKEYACKFNLFPHIKFNCEVTRVEKVAGDEETFYRVSWRD